MWGGRELNWKRDRCPVCGSLPAGDTVGSHNPKWVWDTCSSCGLYWIVELDPKQIPLFSTTDVEAHWELPDRPYDPKVQLIKNTLSGRRSPERFDGHIHRIRSIDVNHGVLLDLGCGDGNMLQCIRKNMEWDRLVGIDFISDLVLFAKQHWELPDIHWLDIREGVPDDIKGQCDLVAMSDVLEHVMIPGDLLSAAVDCLVEGGKIWASFADAASTPHFNPGEWQYWTDASIDHVCDKAGLRIIDASLAEASCLKWCTMEVK